MGSYCRSRGLGAGLRARWPVAIEESGSGLRRGEGSTACASLSARGDAGCDGSKCGFGIDASGSTRLPSMAALLSVGAAIDVLGLAVTELGATLGHESVLRGRSAHRERIRIRAFARSFPDRRVRGTRRVVYIRPTEEASDRRGVRARRGDEPLWALMVFRLRVTSVINLTASP